MSNRTRLSALLAVLFVAPLGCGGDDGPPAADAAVSDAAADDAVSVDAGAVVTGYVISEYDIPQSTAQAMAAARDVDGDTVPDNAFGLLVAAFAGQGASIQPGATDGLQRGNTITLLSTSELAGVVDLGVYAGRNPNPAACDAVMPDDCGKHLTGTGSFEAVTPAADHRNLTGQIAAGMFTTSDAGAVPFALSVNAGAQPFGVTLYGAVAEFATASGGLMNGVIAGGIEEAEVTTLRNMISARVLVQVAADCQGAQPNCCTAGTDGETLFALFDSDQLDCMLSVAEIADSNLMTSLTAPDLDLFNNGTFEPNVDGVNDSLSISMEFAAVGASFLRP